MQPQHLEQEDTCWNLCRDNGRGKKRTYLRCLKEIKLTRQSRKGQKNQLRRLEGRPRWNTFKKSFFTFLMMNFILRASFIWFNNLISGIAKCLLRSYPLVGLFPLSLCSVLLCLLYSLGFKVCFVGYKYCYPSFFSLSICMKYLFLSLYF